MRVIMEPTQHEGGQHKVIIQHPRDDLNIDEVATLLRGALVAYGFHSDTVKEILPEE